MPKINSLGKREKEKFMYPCYTLLTKSNHCAKDEHSWSKYEQAVCIISGVVQHLYISPFLFQLSLARGVRQLLNAQIYLLIQPVHHHSVHASVDMLELLAQVCTHFYSKQNQCPAYEPLMSR